MVSRENECGTGVWSHVTLAACIRCHHDIIWCHMVSYGVIMTSYGVIWCHNNGLLTFRPSCTLLLLINQASIATLWSSGLTPISTSSSARISE